MNKHILIIISVIVAIHNLCAQDTLYTKTIVKHADLDMRYERMVAMPTMGPYVIDGNKLVSLLSDNGSTITFPDGLPLDDLVWIEKDFIVKAYNALYWLGDMSKPIRAFDDTTFLVFPRDTNSLYLVLRHEDMSSVFLFNIKLKAMKRLVTVPGWIVTLSGSKDATMIVTEQSAWLFTDKGCDTYMNFWAPLRDAVMTTHGLVCTTDHYLFLLTAPFQYKILAKGSFDKLLYDMKDLYIVTGEGDLLKVERW